MYLIKKDIPMRVQIALYDKLVAEVIVENMREADRLWASWSVRRYKKGLPMGGALICRSDIPRHWNVNVGSVIL